MTHVINVGLNRIEQFLKGEYVLHLPVEGSGKLFMKQLVDLRLPLKWANGDSLGRAIPWKTHKEDTAIMVSAGMLWLTSAELEKERGETVLLYREILVS